MKNISALTASELLDQYRSSELNPSEVVETCLARIDDTNGHLHAVVTRCDEAARAASEESSRRWETDKARPLEGVPVAVKDIIDTADVATTAGSPIFTGRVPEQNATVVDRLEAAGAIVVAKTTTPELAFGDESGDGCVNPWAPGRWTGGSSSGSAAGLAAAQFPIALGTDTGGSIRVPASYCGVSGLKPTFGLVPRGGVFQISWTLDHVGPMARSVTDLALMLAVMAGPDRRDAHSSSHPVPDFLTATTESVEGLRVGLPDGWLAEGCSPDVLAARDEAVAALEDQGALIQPVHVPTAQMAGAIAWLITVVEFAAEHDERLHDVSQFTDSAAQRLVAGAQTSASDYLRALRSRHRVQQDFDKVFNEVDAIITPATPTCSPEMSTFFDDGDRLWLDKVARNLLIFNLTGMPALVVPAGLSDGLPTAIQIAAPPHADSLCLRVGAAFQRATDHHIRPSPLK